jgi:hypothetical protein
MDTSIIPLPARLHVMPARQCVCLPVAAVPDLRIMTIRKSSLTAVALVLIGGCHHLSVQELQNGQHSVTATSPSGGYSGSREDTIELANEYCAKHGQQAMLDGFFDKSDLGPKGEHTSSLIFSCGPRTKLEF